CGVETGRQCYHKIVFLIVRLFMKRAVLLALAVFLIASHLCATQRYSVTGLVLEVHPAQKTMVVSSQKIPGYMEAMVMPYTVRDAKALDGLKPGTMIEFTLVVDKHAYAENIRIRKYESTEQEPLQASRLELLKDLAGSKSAESVLTVGQP